MSLITGKLDPSDVLKKWGLTLQPQYLPYATLWATESAAEVFIGQSVITHSGGDVHSGEGKFWLPEGATGNICATRHYLFIDGREGWGLMASFRTAHNSTLMALYPRAGSIDTTAEFPFQQRCIGLRL